MSHVFISYSHTDIEYVKKLAKALRDQGFSVWWDDRIKSGDAWFQAIAKAIRNSSAVIVIMTPESGQSEWLEMEILIAKEEKKPLFPLLLRGKRLDILINIQYGNVTGDKLPPTRFYEELREGANALPWNLEDIIPSTNTPRRKKDTVPPPNPRIEDLLTPKFDDKTAASSTPRSISIIF